MSGPCPTFGFVVTFESRAGLPASAPDALWEAWIEFLEGRGLECGGGGETRHEFAVTSEAGQATNEDRVAAEAWLAAHDDVVRWTVSELHDLSHA